MASLGTYLRTRQGNQLAFWCPGCETSHAVTIGKDGWQFNGDLERPTFAPSVLVRGGHFVNKQSCWCAYIAEHPNEPGPFRCFQCHSYVTDGQIKFLNDCSHALAGKTVPMALFP